MLYIVYLIVFSFLSLLYYYVYKQNSFIYFLGIILLEFLLSYRVQKEINSRNRIVHLLRVYKRWRAGELCEMCARTSTVLMLSLCLCFILLYSNTYVIYRYTYTVHIIFGKSLYLIKPFFFSTKVHITLSTACALFALNERLLLR